MREEFEAQRSEVSEKADHFRGYVQQLLAMEEVPHETGGGEFYDQGWNPITEAIGGLVKITAMWEQVDCEDEKQAIIGRMGQWVDRPNVSEKLQKAAIRLLSLHDPTSPGLLRLWSRCFSLQEGEAMLPADIRSRLIGMTSDIPLERLSLEKKQQLFEVFAKAYNERGEGALRFFVKLMGSLLRDFNMASEEVVFCRLESWIANDEWATLSRQAPQIWEQLIDLLTEEDYEAWQVFWAYRSKRMERTRAGGFVSASSQSEDRELSKAQIQALHMSQAFGDNPEAYRQDEFERGDESNFLSPTEEKRLAHDIRGYGTSADLVLADLGEAAQIVMLEARVDPSSQRRQKRFWNWLAEAMAEGSYRHLVMLFDPGQQYSVQNLRRHLSDEEPTSFGTKEKGVHDFILEGIRRLHRRGVQIFFQPQCFCDQNFFDRFEDQTRMVCLEGFLGKVSVAHGLDIDRPLHHVMCSDTTHSFQGEPKGAHSDLREFCRQHRSRPFALDPQAGSGVLFEKPLYTGSLPLSYGALDRWIVLPDKFGSEDVVVPDFNNESGGAPSPSTPVPSGSVV